MSELVIKRKQENDVLTIFAEGRIDTSTAPQFDSEIKSSLTGITKLVIDFTNVSYISSSGLRVLLSLHKTMEANGGEFVITNPTEMVLEVFKVTGFVDVLNIKQ